MIVETQKKLSCGSPPKAQTRKAAERNPGLVTSTKTQRRAGRPAKRWEDDVNEVVKDEETEASQSNDLKNNNTWLVVVQHVYEWEEESKTIHQTRYR